MAYTIPTAFEQVIRKISLTGDHKVIAGNRSTRIVELLREKLHILEAFPTGSILRGTALAGAADVDVFLVLHYGKHIKDKSPRAVLQQVQDALSDYNSGMVKKNGQAVTLYFKTWPNVDIVPAARVVDAQQNVTQYEIPDMVRGRWIVTTPRRHDAAMGAVSERKRQLVRMVKTWNLAHSDLMQSYHIEVIALSVGEITGEWPFEVYWYFKSAVELIDAPLYHPNGAPGRVDEYLNTQDRAEVKERLIRARDWALWGNDASTKGDHATATRFFRLIFGDDFPAYG
jgi:hypothetical protein